MQLHEYLGWTITRLEGTPDGNITGKMEPITTTDALHHLRTTAQTLRDHYSHLWENNTDDQH